MTTLPLEVWRECFLYLCFEDQKNLSLTCSTFNDICRSLVFESIRYQEIVDYYKGMKASEMQEQVNGVQQQAQLFKDMAHSPKYAPFIRKLSLEYRAPGTSTQPRGMSAKLKQILRLYVDAVVESIPQLVNLRVVIVKEFKAKMDKKIFIALAKHPRLEEVSFQNSSFKCGAYHLKPHIKLRRLSIANQRRSDPNTNPSVKVLDLFSSEELRSLDVESSTYSTKLFRAFTKQGHCKHLTSLSFRIKYDDFHEFYAFLPACPFLQSLKIEYIPRRNPVVPPDPLPDPTVVPQLASFTGPGAIASIFVPGRPVSRVRLDSHELQAECLIWWFGVRVTLAIAERSIPEISKSSAPITHLTLDYAPCNALTIGLITAHLPALVFLRLGLTDERAFPDEDPEKTTLDSVLKIDKNEQGSFAEAIMQPALIHAKYMSILHWAANGRIKLPMVLEELHVEEQAYKFDKSSDAAIQSQPYTFGEAQDILQALSIYYPALHLIWIGHDDTEKFRWEKEPVAIRGWKFS